MQKFLTRKCIWSAIFVGMLDISCFLHLGTAAEPLWEKEPVVYTQAITGVSSDDYYKAQEKWNVQGYSPLSLSAVRSPYRGVQYSGLWKKDPKIVTWESQEEMAPLTFNIRHTQLISQQYRVYDLDVHVKNGVPFYNAIWVKEQSAIPSKISKKLSRGSLNIQLAHNRALGYRPTRLNAYQIRETTYYSVVWIQDGITDYEVELDQTSTQLEDLKERQQRRGYVPIDVAAYHKNGLRFSSIWVRDPIVKNWKLFHGQSDNSLTNHQQDLRKENYRMIDVDTYFASALKFVTLHSGIWIQTEPRNQLISNLSLGTNSTLLQLRNKITEYITAGTDSRSGSLGFFIEDLTNGNYIAYNPHEPFYLASTAKVFIGAKIADMPELNMHDPLQLHQLTDEDWRGETTRGFVIGNIGDSFSTSTYMRNMIDHSDTASTDKLYGLIEEYDGETATDSYVRRKCDIQNIGKITTICEVDKRIHVTRHSCVLDVPCHTFETWVRNHQDESAVPTATNEDLICFKKLKDSGVVGDARRAPYYASLANTITPAEYGRFWSKLARHELLKPADERYILKELDRNDRNPFSFSKQNYFDETGGKGGDKYEVKSWVGIAWNWNKKFPKPQGILPQYSISVFTEDWSGDWKSSADDSEYRTKKSKANTIINDVIKNTIPFLESKRFLSRR